MTVVMPQKSTLTTWLQLSSLRITRIRFIVLALFAFSTMADDAWNLIPGEVAASRWIALAVVGFINTLLWFASRNNVKSEFFYKGLLYCQIIMDILFISLLIFSQRGIASRGVMLYAVPIISAAVLLSRSAIYAAAALCASAYTVAVMRYQFLHPSEGYKIELYGQLALYGAIFFVVAALLQVVIRSKRT